MPRPEYVIVVAMTRERVIGQGGRIPWRLPQDLRLFRELTTGHAVVMGRRTFDSIGGALPGRRNLVLSRTLSEAPEVEVCGSFEEALAKTANCRGKVFFVGGAQVYAQALPLADAMVVSWIEGNFPGETLFPPFDEGEWRAVRTEHHPGFTRVWYRRAGVPTARIEEAKDPSCPA
jgi:dihydrofolate reductase